MRNNEKIAFLPDRLRAVLKDRRFTRSALCSALGLSVDTYGGYMKTGRIMPGELRKICEFLDTDTEYIAGLVDTDAGYYQNLNRVSQQETIKVTVPLTFSRADLIALLLEAYGFPHDVYTEARNDPGASLMVSRIDSALLYWKDEKQYKRPAADNREIKDTSQNGLLQRITKERKK